MFQPDSRLPRGELNEPSEACNELLLPRRQYATFRDIGEQDLFLEGTLGDISIGPLDSKQLSVW
jgi:hypothetical protein